MPIASEHKNHMSLAINVLTVVVPAHDQVSRCTRSQGLLQPGDGLGLESQIVRRVDCARCFRRYSRCVYEHQLQSLRAARDRVNQRVVVIRHIPAIIQIQCGIQDLCLRDSVSVVVVVTKYREKRNIQTRRSVYPAVYRVPLDIGSAVDSIVLNGIVSRLQVEVIAK